MFKNYIRIAWRSLIKNPIYSLVNIFGLAIGIGAFLFIATYVRYETSYEKFNPNASNVLRITLDIYNGSEYVVTDCETHAVMGPILKSRFPEVKDYVRVFDNDGLTHVQVGDKKFLEERLFYADPSIVDILGVKVINGEPSKFLNDPWQVVITESTAKKLFGKTDVIGETLIVDGRPFHVTGTVADAVPNTHLKFNILLSHSTLPLKKSWYKEDGWNGNNEFTYLLMQPGTDLEAFNRKLLVVSEELKEKLDDDKYTAETITSIHLYSNKTYEPEANGSAKTVYFLMVIAVFIIVIAWVNYMNLATARAVERAREVGIRKVVGSMKAQLVIQFLTEALIVNMIAAIIGLALFQMTTPLFRDLTGLPSTLNFTNDVLFWSLFGALAVVGALLAGAYPAFVLSSFKPVAVLKGRFHSSVHGQWLRKALVVFQFATTVVLIIGVSTVYRQVGFLRSTDIGTNLDHVLAIRRPQMEVTDSVMSAKHNSFKTELNRDPSIVSVARCETLPGLALSEMSTNNFSRMGQEEAAGSYEYYWQSVDEDFVPTMDIRMLAGRNFDGAGSEGNVLINEEAARRLGFQSPEEAIGAQINFTDWRTKKPSVIIGVMKNYYQRSPKEAHLPMMLVFMQRGDYFLVRVNTDDTEATLARIKESWDRIFPSTVFHYFFADEKFDQQFKADVQFGEVMGIFSTLAVMIACLGLFGLSSYTIVQRTKEIGIRKVLGASVTQIVRLLSTSYLRTVLTASLLALPVAYFGANNWLSGYSVRISLNAWMFVLPVVLIVSIALFTVGFQTVKSALGNPVDSLKQE